jgi:hypothetical protein
MWWQHRGEMSIPYSISMKLIYETFNLSLSSLYNFHVEKIYFGSAHYASETNIHFFLYKWQT